KATHIIRHRRAERCRRPNGAVVYQRIQPTEVAMCPIDHRPGGILIAEIGAKCSCRMAALCYFMGKFLSMIERSIGMNGDTISARRKPAHDRRTNSQRPTGDQSDRLRANLVHRTIRSIEPSFIELIAL